MTGSYSIERHIVIGLIVSTKFISRIEQFWDDDYIEAQMALRISGWCFEYYRKYKKAPLLLQTCLNLLYC